MGPLSENGPLCLLVQPLSAGTNSAAFSRSPWPAVPYPSLTVRIAQVPGAGNTSLPPIFMVSVAVYFEVILMVSHYC